MPVPLPFKISLAAEDHIRGLLAHRLPSGFEPGLVLCFASESRSRHGELTEQFRGKHFTIAGDTPQQWLSARSAVQVVIVGREFWIPRETVEALRGKTLTVKPCDVGYGKHAGTIRELLVAAS